MDIEVIRVIAFAVILLLAIPVGYLIAWMARDEIIAGRRWFSSVVVLFAVFGGFAFIKGWYVEALTSGFVIIVSFIAQLKSYDKKFAVRPFR